MYNIPIILLWGGLWAELLSMPSDITSLIENRKEAETKMQCIPLHQRGILEQQRALKVLGARPTDVWIRSDPLLISVPSMGQMEPLP